MSPNTPKFTRQLVDDFTRKSREAGLKVTPQRIAIFEALADAASHPTAEEIHAKIVRRMPTVSVDTVYRTLTTLLDNNLIKRVDSQRGSSRYDTNVRLHHHFVCTRCNSIQDFYWPEFDAMKLPEEIRTMGRVEEPYVELRGLCTSCAKATKA